MDKEKLKKQLSDLDMELLTDLKKELDIEMNKPVEERDENLISELEDMISETEDELISESKKRSLESVLKMLDEYEAPKHIKLYKRFSVVAACFLFVLGINTVSMKTFGQNIFSAIYQLTKGGITISANNSGDTDITVSGSDPYGMKAKCAEYGFFPDTPSYIPDGFVLNDIYEESNDVSDNIIFFYKKNDVKLNFYFTNYKTNDEIPPLGVPTDTYNVTEEQVNGRTTYILKEDKQFTADFIDCRIDYYIFAEYLDYDECQKVLESMS